MRKLLLSLLLLVGLQAQVCAQGENQNWYFGANAGLSFSTGTPTALPSSAMNTYEACASVSDSAGNLLFYTNGVEAWNKNHQLMPNGQVLGAHESATQGAAIVRRPGSSDQYYIFAVDGCDNLLAGGLKYSVVDMSQQAGLGAVTTKAVQLSAVRLTEKLTIAVHANGIDQWVLVHGWQTNQFYAYLVTANGVSTTPVVTAIGKVHQGGGGNLGNANGVGYMRVSPAGNKLALGIRDENFELFDFDNSTGRLSNYLPLTQFYRSYGVEFSPDGSRLYGSNLDGYGVYQFDLSAGSAAAIAASGRQIGTTQGFAGAIQRGPDGKLYIAQYSSAFLSVIDNPNALGTACQFRSSAISLNGRLCQIGLPNFPNQIAPQPSAIFTASTVCLGSATVLEGEVRNVPNATFTWNFGDPASGASNTGSGAVVTHLYSAAGTFAATMTVSAPSLAIPLVVRQSVIVNAPPVISLGPARQVCAGQEVVLQASAQPAGTTYRWQDGSTAATFTARTAGTYTLTVTSAQGCSASSSTTVAVLPAATVSLGRDTTLCLQNPLVLRPSAQPAGTTYRWQDGSTASTYEVLNPGTYSVSVTPPGACPAQDEIVVRSAQCPFTIPNIITPNQDQRNETFVLKGLNPRAWNLTVFNRWGQQVYQKTSYDNSWNAAGQPDGVYYYLLRNPTTAEQYRGWVQVSR